MQINFLPCVSLLTMIEQSMICLSDVYRNRLLLKMKAEDFA
ncbi:hypothetical protein CLONEX_04220 [[Clostridium] nexile DSM 1787]|nr:hypothetical protein CLONEX_04220 [[Clostridium] nexile DSM 1787]